MWGFDHNLIGEAAPEISGAVWFNLENLPASAQASARAGEPVPFSSLVGYVVLLDFWAYSSASCARTFPYLRHWWQTYHTQPFLIIGVHTPEFEFEKDPENLESAVLRFELDYPVVGDAEAVTWQAYNSKKRPRQIVVDQNGTIRFDHSGEGGYEQQEAAITSLLTPAATT